VVVGSWVVVSSCRSPGRRASRGWSCLPVVVVLDVVLVVEVVAQWSYSGSRSSSWPRFPCTGSCRLSVRGLVPPSELVGGGWWWVVVPVSPAGGWSSSCRFVVCRGDRQRRTGARACACVLRLRPFLISGVTMNSWIPACFNAPLSASLAAEYGKPAVLAGNVHSVLVDRDRPRRRDRLRPPDIDGNLFRSGCRPSFVIDAGDMDAPGSTILTAAEGSTPSENATSPGRHQCPGPWGREWPGVDDLEQATPRPPDAVLADDVDRRRRGPCEALPRTGRPGRGARLTGGVTGQARRPGTLGVVEPWRTGVVTVAGRGVREPWAS